MNIVTPEQMTEIDRLTIQDFGLSSLVLMENAARSVLPHLPPGRTCIFVGPGNNGGDGLVLARALAEQGREVEVLLLSDKQSSDARTQLKLARAWNVPINSFSQADLNRACNQSDVVIDAIFGTGLKRNLEGHWQTTVEAINQAKNFCLALDIPSGVNGSDGQIMGTAIKADKTVTFGCLKPAHLLHPGKSHCGTVSLTQPGFHPEALAHFDRIQLFTKERATRHLPKLWPTAHKGDNGKLLLITGSRTYPGAGLLTVLGALRAGAGLVSQSTHAELIPALLSSTPEAMPICRPEAPDLSRFNALVVGSGLGPDSKTIGLETLKNSNLPTVVDADCLELVPTLPEEQRNEFILTPHPGELARLLGCSVESLEKDRISIALAAASQLKCVVCFKGAPTVTASPDGRAYVNCTGNPVLAQGGTGDLLAGMIGALLAYGLPKLEAAASAAFIHGLAADLAMAKIGPRGVTAAQIGQLVPIAYEEAVGNPSPFPVF